MPLRTFFSAGGLRSQHRAVSKVGVHPQKQGRGSLRLEHLLQRQGVLQLEPGRHGPAQAAHAAPAPQCPANIMTQGAHIGPLGTPDPQGVIRRPRLLFQRQAVDGDGPGLPLHLLALSGQLIELLSSHLDGGVHGGDLQDLSPERPQCLPPAPPGSRRPGRSASTCAGGVLGVGRPRPAAARLHIPFSDSEANSTARVARPTNTGSTPVAMGSSVPAWPTRLSWKMPSQLGAHVHTGPILGLVDDDDAVSHERTCSIAHRMARLASSTLPSTVAPGGGGVAAAPQQGAYPAGVEDLRIGAQGQLARPGPQLPDGDRSSSRPPPVPQRRRYPPGPARRPPAGPPSPGPPPPRRSPRRHNSSMPSTIRLSIRRRFRVLVRKWRLFSSAAGDAGLHQGGRHPVGVRRGVSVD